MTKKKRSGLDRFMYIFGSDDEKLEGGDRTQRMIYELAKAIREELRNMTTYLIAVTTDTDADTEIYKFNNADDRADFINVITNMDGVDYATSECED
jgi:hypothetical protein